MSNPAIPMVTVKSQQRCLPYDCECGAKSLVWSHTRERKGHVYVVFVCRQCYQTEVEKETGVLGHI